MKDVKSSALIPADKIPYANGEPYYVTISTTDNATGKPTSVVADFTQIIPAVEAALQARQVQPLFC